jgi:TrwC relaxase
LLAAAFVHRSSRAGDPQLHAHVLVSGRVRCSDGVWRAVFNSRTLHRELKTAGMVYQAALRVELANRLGVAWTPVDRHGQAEIVGVPTELRALFSKRAAVVEARARELIAEAEAKLGREVTPKGRRRFYEVAVLETRTAKEPGGELDEGLFDRWRSEAITAGYHPERWFGAVLNGQQPPCPRRSVIVAEVLDELSTTVSTWKRSDVVRQVARGTPLDPISAAAARSWIETTTDEVLAHPAIVRLAAPEPAPPADLRRRDGQSVFERNGAVRYTTHATHGR